MLVQKYGKITVFGPHPLERDDEGHLKYHMADIFPSYSSMIVGTGLHVSLAMDFIAKLGNKRGRELDEKEQQAVCEDLVALIMRGDHVLIRSIPDNMEKCFRAAELLEEVVPTEMIRFTGRRDPKVREAFKLRGECWKMTPRYFTAEEIIKQINLSKVSVGTKNCYYYKVESGGRLITFANFAAIAESISDFQEFKDRINEVVDLHKRRNEQFVRELDFFKVDRRVFDFSLSEKLAKYLNSCKSWGKAQKTKANKLFLAALENFKAAIPPEFQCDDPHNPVWRNYVYSELNEIPPTEESMLGISGEFNMNIRWLPGYRIRNGRVEMDPHVEEPVARLLEDFFRLYGPLEYINLGRLMRSQSTKRAAGSYREVFIAVLKQKNSETEQIRILRKVMRNILYFLNRGHSLERAKQLAEGYLEYTFDRREILSLLGVNTPVVGYLSRKEGLPGIGTVPVTFFDRPYIDGLATDKVSDYYYEHEGFVRAQADLLGYEAGLNLIIGRVDPDTGAVYFGDGDEMLQFGDDWFEPTGLVLADFTGTFADVISPLEKFIPYYADYVIDMLFKVKVKGLGREGLLEIGGIFIEAMKKRIVQTRQMFSGQSEVRGMIDDLVARRDEDVNPVKVKWEKTLQRLQNLNADDFIKRFQDDVRRKLGFY